MSTCAVDERDHLVTTGSAPASDQPSPGDIASLTARLARKRAQADAAGTPESGDSALFAAVARQAQAAEAAVAAVEAAAAIAEDTQDAGAPSRTASWASTPSVERETPHAADTPRVFASSVGGIAWPGTPGADPTAWLAAQLDRFSHGDHIDPYAELMLRRAGFAPGAR